MRALGIDLGTKTMGLAITDSMKIIASGLENFSYQNQNLNICLKKISDLVVYYHNDLDTIVLGYPLNVNGSKNQQTLYVESFFQLLKDNFPKLNIVLQDERYSTINATGMLKYEAKLKSSQIKKIKDKMAAVIILQEYLDTRI